MAFYDSWGDKLQKTGMDAIEKTKNTAESVRLKTAISDMEKDILSAYTEIGKLYYQKLKDKETDEEMLVYFQKIESRKKQIEEHQTRIRDLKGMTQCKNCGKEIEKNIRFCNFCGAEQFQKIEIGLLQQELDKCPNCGSKVRNGQAFCTTCGLKLDMVVTPKTEKRICVVCGYELDEDAVFCTNCGNRIEKLSDQADTLEEMPEVAMMKHTEPDVSAELGIAHDTAALSEAVAEGNMAEREMARLDMEQPLPAGKDGLAGNEAVIPMPNPGSFVDLEHSEPDDNADSLDAFTRKSISDDVHMVIHESEREPEQEQEAGQILEPEQEEPEQILEPEHKQNPGQEQKSGQEQLPGQGQKMEQAQELEREVVSEESIRLSEYISKKLSVAEKEEKTLPRFCIYCGEQLESDAVFCTNCGHKQ